LTDHACRANRESLTTNHWSEAKDVTNWKKTDRAAEGVTVKVNPEALDIQGPKGKLTQRIPPGIGFESWTASSRRRRCARTRRSASFTASRAALAANGVLGVTEGFKRELDIVGVGYRAELRGKQVVFALGTRTRWCSTCRRASTSRLKSRPTSP
jgi:ribosomal protein L6P/L9E